MPRAISEPGVDGWRGGSAGLVDCDLRREPPAGRRGIAIKRADQRVARFAFGLAVVGEADFKGRRGEQEIVYFFLPASRLPSSTFSSVPFQTF